MIRERFLLWVSRNAPSQRLRDWAYKHTVEYHWHRLGGVHGLTTWAENNSTVFLGTLEPHFKPVELRGETIEDFLRRMDGDGA